MTEDRDEQDEQDVFRELNDFHEQDGLRKHSTTAVLAENPPPEISAGHRTHYLYEWKVYVKEHREQAIDLDDYVRMEIAKLDSMIPKSRSKV